MKDMRCSRPTLWSLLFGLGLFALPTILSAQSHPEPSNLPISKVQLRRNIRASTLIAHALITAYEPPIYRDHVATLEKTTIKLEDVYMGNLASGASLTYSCLCHYEQTPKPADMVGHQILIFLKVDRHTHSWFPSSGEAQFFDDPTLRNRIREEIKETR